MSVVESQWHCRDCVIKKSANFSQLAFRLKRE
jgi:hypothetical protein